MVAVPTVTGSVDSADLGRVLAHEHVFVLGEEYRQNYADDWDEDAPIRIPDPKAVKPAGWLDDAEALTPPDRLADLAVSGG